MIYEQGANDMPTKNPRVLVTLKPDTKRSLERLSEASGDSQSKIVSDLLDFYMPVLEGMYEQAMELKKKHMNEIKELQDGMVQVF